MKFNLIFLIYCVIILYSNYLCGQNYSPIRFQNFNIDNGLSNNNVNTIFQDSYGFIWIGTNNGLNRYNGYKFKHYLFDSSNTSSLSGNAISKIWEDDSRHLWIATNSHILNRFNPQTETFERVELDEISTKIISLYKEDANSLLLGCRDSGELKSFNTSTKQVEVIIDSLYHCKTDNSIDNVYVDSKGIIWFSDWQKLYTYDTDTDSLECYSHNSKDENSLSAQYVSSFYEDSKGNFWIGTANGLNRWNAQDNNFTNIFPNEYITIENTPHNNYISGIQEDKYGNLWLATPEALIYFDINKNQFSNYSYKLTNILKGGINDLIIDNSGSLWIATKTGVSLLLPNAKQFYQNFHQTILPEGLHANDSKNIIKVDRDYWLSSNTGLYKTEYSSDQVNHTKIDDRNFHAIHQSSNGDIYAGALAQGIFRFKNDKLIQHFPYHTNSIHGSYIYDIEEDHTNKLWIAAYGELNRLDPNTAEVIYYHQEDYKVEKEVDLSTVFSLRLDHSENLWIGTATGLVFLAKEEIQKPLGSALHFKHFKHDPLQSNSLSNTRINYIYVSSKHDIWIATNDGLNLLKNGNFIHYKKELANNKVMSILEDNKGDLWLGTANGLSHFDIVNKTFRNYNKADGLPSNNFLHGHCFKDDDGTMVFGTEDGIISFNPKKLTDNEYISPHFIVEMRLFNEMVEVGSHDSLLKKPILFTESIELNHKQNVITFEFATLNYFDSPNNQYAYQLVGFDERWQHIRNRREVTFTNLNPGQYILKIKSANNNGIWNEKIKSLQINIIPPWYKTWWAYITWVLISITILYKIYKTHLNHQLIIVESKKLKEINLFKSNLFTNITHEFRTPLTLILGPANKAYNEVDRMSKAEVKEQFQLIEKNGKSLLDRVNQILDLSKLEAGLMPINIIHEDIVAYLSYITESFHSFASAQQVVLNFKSDIESLIIDFDKEKIQTILSNLIGNAIKFTPIGGLVNIHFSFDIINKKIIIDISDTGQGIPQTEISSIFKRYYQVKKLKNSSLHGSGIGLAIVKELVELLEGNIKVNSSMNQGTSFTITFPVTNVQSSNSKLITIEKAPLIPHNKVPHKNINSEEEQSLILIIEDNNDVANYISSCLGASYHLAFAKNGKEGVEKAKKLIPDFIISDVMMPIMDGFEVCQSLKSNLLTEHIPVLLLTAKADQSSRLEGFQKGADAYLIKPFNEKELLIRIEQLIALRKKLQTKYQKLDQYFEQANTAQLSQAENVFIEKIRLIVETHINDYNFDVQKLCKKAGVSRTQLHRKIKSITNHSTTQFIRSIKYKKAKELLISSQLTIAEVAYETGFNTPSYFSRMFHQEMGISPTDFRKSAFKEVPPY